MGIKEYHFLTKTMNEIEINSNEILNLKNKIKNDEKYLNEELENKLSSREKLESLINERRYVIMEIRSEKNVYELEKERKELKALAAESDFGESFLGQKATYFLKEFSIINWLKISAIFYFTVGFLLQFFIPLFDIGGFVCDNGEHTSHFTTNNGFDDCGDNSDEGIDEFTEVSGSILFFFFSLLVGAIYASINVIKGNVQITKITNRISQIDDDLGSYRYQKNEMNKLRNKVKKLMGNENLEQLKENIQLFKKSIEACNDNISTLEEQNKSLWDSISNLIPFSAALDKK